MTTARKDPLKDNREMHRDSKVPERIVTLMDLIKWIE